MSDQKGQVYYFASDFHLGIDCDITSLDREKKIVQWLHEIKIDARAIYLVGDIFDYWFEYKHVVPKGYVRLLGTLAQLVDDGIEVHYFKGNHDMWIYDYFKDDLGFQIHDDGLYLTLHGRSFFIAHGDGLGQGDGYYKLIKKILRNPLAQRLFAFLHPSIGLPLMKKMSRRSRLNDVHTEDAKEQSNMIQYAEEISERIDYFICGHRHFPILKYLSNNKTQYCNLGDWMTHFSYARWDGEEFRLLE